MKTWCMSNRPLLVVYLGLCLTGGKIFFFGGGRTNCHVSYQSQGGGGGGGRVPSFAPPKYAPAFDFELAVWLAMGPSAYGGLKMLAVVWRDFHLAIIYNVVH